MVRCIYNSELVDAITTHGKVLVHAGSSVASDTAAVATDLLQRETTDQHSTQADLVDHGSAHVESVSCQSVNARPVFSVMPEDVKLDSTKTAATTSAPVKLRTTTKPTDLDAEPPGRGTEPF